MLPILVRCSISLAYLVWRCSNCIGCLPFIYTLSINFFTNKMCYAVMNVGLYAFTAVLRVKMLH